MKRIILAASASAVAALGASAVLVLSASGTSIRDNGVEAAMKAFPALQSTAAAPASSRLPTASKAATVVGRGVVGDGNEIIVTREGDFCLKVGSGYGCTTADQASRTGAFSAAISCTGRQPVATITGVVPTGVTAVSANSPNGVAGAAVGTDGSVFLTVPGGVARGLRLSNGQVAPFELGNDCDRSSAITVKARPAS